LVSLGNATGKSEGVVTPEDIGGEYGSLSEVEDDPDGVVRPDSVCWNMAQPFCTAGYTGSDAMDDGGVGILGAARADSLLLPLPDLIA